MVWILGIQVGRPRLRLLFLRLHLGNLGDLAAFFKNAHLMDRPVQTVHAAGLHDAKVPRVDRVKSDRRDSVRSLALGLGGAPFFAVIGHRNLVAARVVAG